jgi:hypothetical protein
MRPTRVAPMGRNGIRRRSEREGDILFTSVNSQRSRIFFALASAGRYAYSSSHRTHRSREPDSHDGWIRGKGIPPLSAQPLLYLLATHLLPRNEASCGVGWPCLRAGASLISGGCGQDRPRRDAGPTRAGPTRNTSPDPTGRAFGDRRNDRRTRRRTDSGKGFASRGEGRCAS